MTLKCFWPLHIDAVMTSYDTLLPPIHLSVILINLQARSEEDVGVAEGEVPAATSQGVFNVNVTDCQGCHALLWRLSVFGAFFCCLCQV